MKELSEYGNETVWAVTTKYHPFWSNVFNKGFTYNDIVHRSVTGFGYSKRL
jgi:hypothetical protein